MFVITGVNDENRFDVYKAVEYKVNLPSNKWKISPFR